MTYCIIPIWQKLQDLGKTAPKNKVNPDAEHITQFFIATFVNSFRVDFFPITSVSGRQLFQSSAGYLLDSAFFFFFSGQLACSSIYCSLIGDEI